MRTPAEVREQTVREWVRLARADLEYAQIGVSAGAEPALIGFHAQQAVEKLLKALLITYEVDPGETHEIGRLVERIRLLNRPVADSLGSVGRLTPYAVFYRYPPRVPGHSRSLDRSHVIEGVALARDASDTLTAVIEQRLIALTKQRPEQSGGIA